MKTLKTILIAATLISATAVPSVSAQEAAPAQQHEFKVAKGDSVMIKRECQQYLTGERPSVWVWDKVHTVYQLGTKKYPDGVLLMNIYSWICEECLIPVNGHADESEAQAVEEQKEVKAAFEEAKKEEKKAAPAKQAEEPVKEEPKAEEAVPAVVPAVVAPVEEAKAEEPAQVAEEPKAEEVKEEEAKVEEVKEEEPVAEEPDKPIEQPVVEVVTKQAAKGDSIHSKQNFRGGYDRFTIGVRGGAASLLHQAVKGNWTCGGDVLLDLQYAHYWTKDGRPVDLGIITGLSVGYAQSGLKTAYDSTSFTDANVDYTVVARDIKETDHTIQLEVPVMFSLIHESGFFFNIGPKFMVPVYSPYKQTVDQANTHISAYVHETGVTVIDNPVTGQYTGQQPTTANGIQFKINIMLTAEIGYEWTLNSGNSLGLGAYANYSVFNTYSNAVSTKGLFNLTAPTDNDIFKLDVLSATKTYADKIGYFDAGIKVAYHFNFPKKKKNSDSKLF